jgi:hypothetical protein
MKKSFLIFISILIANSNSFYSQDASEVAAGLAVGAAIAAVSVSSIKEEAELRATQYILSNYDNFKKFNVKAMISSSSTKLTDMSRASIIPFEVYEFDIIDKDYGEYDFKVINRFILMCYGTSGFINQYGVRYNMVSWELIDKELWFKRLEKYVESSSNTSLDIAEALEEGFVVNKGVTKKGDFFNSTNLAIEFYNLNSDSYIVSDYSDEFKYIYNENSLGIFNKKTKVLSQIRRKTILEISKFLKKSLD